MPDDSSAYGARKTRTLFIPRFDKYLYPLTDIIEIQVSLCDCKVFK